MYGTVANQFLVFVCIVCCLLIDWEISSWTWTAWKKVEDRGRSAVNICRHCTYSFSHSFIYSYSSEISWQPQLCKILNIWMEKKL